MQSSFNLIKGTKASVNGDKSINTHYIEVKGKDEDNTLEQSSEAGLLKSYELLGSNIIKKARNDAEGIIVESTKKAREIEKEAYEKGYLQGQANGYEDGSKEGYSKAIEDGNKEISQIIDKAYSILANAEREYEEYKLAKEKEIINLALEMAKIISSKEFEKSDSLLQLIEPVIEEAKGEDSIVIRCNSKYINSIKDKVDFWKNTYGIKGEVFILEDPIMELGKGIIEKSTGKIIVGMDITFEKLEAVLKEHFIGGNND